MQIEVKSFSPRVFSRVLFGFLFLVMASIPVRHAYAATYALEIIQPRAGLTTSNRYYKAYPGLAYDVQISAIGGTYPYKFALTSAPSGMSVVADSGVVKWSNPIAQAQPYAVAVRVTDASGAVASVQWSVLVTTQGFKFLDAQNGRRVSEGGDGSASNPWKSIADWYVNKNDTSNKGVFLYWRNGTYRTVDAPVEDGWRLAVLGGSKPVVWLAYPGEKPVIDTTGSHVAFYGGTTNTYVEGFAIRNFTTNFGVRIDSDGTGVVFRKNEFSNLPAGAGGTGTNASALMIAKATKGTYWSIVDNVFKDVHDVGYGILGYLTDRTLVQGNQFSNFTARDSKSIGPKMANSMWFIRDNRINMSQGDGIWVDTYSDGGNATRDVEISYNLVQVASGNTVWIGQEAVQYGAVTSFRNTYVGAQVRVDNLTSSSGPVSFDRDVVVNDTSAVNKIVSGALSLLKIGSLLTGSLQSGIVDASGNLADSYKSYIGTHGYQRIGLGVTPEPPQLSVN